MSQDPAKSVPIELNYEAGNTIPPEWHARWYHWVVSSAMSLPMIALSAIWLIAGGVPDHLTEMTRCAGCFFLLIGLAIFFAPAHIENFLRAWKEMRTKSEDKRN